MQSNEKQEFMNVLVFTNMYPYPAKPYYGIFVKEQVKSLKKIGAEIDVLFINGELSKLNYLKCFRKFFNTLSKKHYDIIHCHHTYCAFVAALQKRIPVILTFHEGEIFSQEHFGKKLKQNGFWKTFGLSEYFKRLVLKKVNYIISVTKELKNIVPQEKLSIIPPGIDLNLFKPISKIKARQKLKLPLNEKIVLFPADPNRKEKRFDLTKQTIDNLKKEGMDIILITLGDVKYENVPYYMNAADVVLFTSDYEASPMVIKEAMACNIPIVSTDVGDIKWVINTTDGCYICKRIPEDIAHKIKKALDYNKRTNGRKHIAQMKFDLKVTIGKTIKVYKKISEKL